MPPDAPVANVAETWCAFRLGRWLFGVEVDRVLEVLRVAQVTPVPLAPASVRGLINLRGQIVTAIDLRGHFGLHAAIAKVLRPHVVVRSSRGTITLIVDTIEDVLRTRADQFEPCPETLQGVPREMIRGCYKLERELLLVLDLDRALDVAAT